MLTSAFGRRRQVQRHSRAHRLLLSCAAADGKRAEEGPAGDAADELPLWRFLRQQGFSADSISRMQATTVVSGGRRYTSVTGTRIREEKVQRDLAPSIAALRAEGLDTASIERLFMKLPRLLTATQETFASALAALRLLAALLPDDPRTVQAPPGATQLGMALWLYPSSAHILFRANLGSLIDGNLQLWRQLGLSDSETAVGLFQHPSALVSNFERAEAMVAHLQHLQASGTLSAEHGEQELPTAASSIHICLACQSCCDVQTCMLAGSHLFTSFLAHHLPCSGKVCPLGSDQIDPCRV